VRAPAVDLVKRSAVGATTRLSQRRVLARRALTVIAPALVLGWLGLSQVEVVVRGWAAFDATRSWTVVSEIIRSALYAAFVLGAAITLLSSKSARARDGRRVAVVTSLTATFLMVGLSFMPAGPFLWRASANVEEFGLALTVTGAFIALVAFLNLGANFSIAPEARDLVVTGPYRLLRHPIYFAELVMIDGIVVGSARLTTLIGAIGVLGLQIYRIAVEEKLLRENFPRTFAEFTTRTSYRLVPLVW
jgi:protein-S-isoprenylcysteine O-methyltransferase Ste14